jgi:hypothetical protein
MAFVKILDAIEKARGQSVDIGCSCGLGRRTPQEANQCLQLMKKVVVTQCGNSLQVFA